MCPDQLFAALSAWYTCAISFNRWHSVCRPSSYFFSVSVNKPVKSFGTMNKKINQNNYQLKKRRINSAFSSSLSSSTSRFKHCCLDCGSCFTKNLSFRSHLQAFRCISIITLVGVLCCLYPIFMHELRPVILTNQRVFGSEEKNTHTYAVVWKRCYYSPQHEYAYDIIGIILSCFLHVLPLTFVGVINFMIIIRLRQRQLLMSNSIDRVQSSSENKGKKERLKYMRQRLSDGCTSVSRKKNAANEHTQTNLTIPSQTLSTRTHLDELILIDASASATTLKNPNIVTKLKGSVTKRHSSRDRTITTMLVSIALSYLILTIPYRLFWSYNVYIKRVYPEKLNSSVYLLEMHCIDHVLRTIRNIHYGTNFIFFVFLSKTFRQKFKELCFQNLFSESTRLLDQNVDPCGNNTGMNKLRRDATNLEEEKTKYNQNN